MRIAIYLAVSLFVLSLQAANACDLIDVATAEEVLGSEVIDVTSDPETFCVFVSSKTAARLTVQKDPRDSYDLITIPIPHETVDVGDEGRSHEFPEGGAAVQFVAGDASFTLGVRTPGGADERDYVIALTAVAEKIASGVD